MSKKAQKPPRMGSSLTDAVVAALAKVDDKTEVDPQPAAAESGCAATEVPTGSGPPAKADAAATGAAVTGAAGPNGFRSGPGSFSDLMRRWAGGAPVAAAAAAAAPAVAEPKAEPPKVDAKAEPPKVDAKAEPPKVEEEPEADEAKTVEEPPVVETAEPPTVVDDKPDAEAEPPPDDTLEEESVEAPSDAAVADGVVDLHYYGRTDVGLVREHNEDNFLVAEITEEVKNAEEPRDVRIDERGSIFAVCDGMGGAAAGEVASQMAVDTIFEVMAASPPATDRDDYARRLVTAIEEAGHRIFSAAKMDRTRRGMGTTATLAGLVDNVLFVGQVGDSRAYVLRGDALVMITKDQSLVNQLIEAGQLTEDEAEAFEHSNIILQALGTTEDVTVDLTFLEMRRGDRLMMCSDGLSGLVHADMMKEVLQTTKDLVEASGKLTQMANAGGGHDNITVIVADFDGTGLSAPGDAMVSYQQYPLPPADETKRGKSLPPRATSMKAGATKPGADVKGGDYSGPSEDVELGGGDSKIGMIVVAAIVLVALVAGGWFLMNMGGDETEASDTAPLPTEPEDPFEDEMPVEDPLADPGEDGIEATIGAVEISTDIEEGNLFIGEENRGPITNGMVVDLAPGAYTVEARSGTAVIASGSVTVREDATASIELNMPVAPPEDPPEDSPPRGEGRSDGEGRRGSGEGRRRRRSGGGGATGGGADGPLPTNPF